jgi:hypothetical protein
MKPSGKWHRVSMAINKLYFVLSKRKPTTKDLGIPEIPWQLDIRFWSAIYCAINIEVLGVQMGLDHAKDIIYLPCSM